MVPIKDAPGYFITTSGEVYSTKRGGMKKLKPMENTHGYLTVDLRGVGLGMKSIHRLVAEAFIEKTAETVNHKNGNRQDNRVENLEWLSFHDNQLHHFRILKRHIGDEHWNTKLTERDVATAFELHRAGMTKKDIALRFGVDRSTITLRMSK